MVDKHFKKVDFLLVIFFCLALLPVRLLAQTEAEDYLVINRLSRDNGLPDQDINGICFDSVGYAWLSTFGGGLVRYDGDSFIRFSQKTDPEFLSDFVCQSCEDGFGRLWVPCAGGMNILDLKTLTLVDEFPGLPKGWRRSLAPGEVSRDAKGCIWFPSGDYLYRISFADDGERFIADSLQCNVSNSNLMSSICDVDDDGSAWVSINGRIYKVRHIEERGLFMSEILPGIDIGEDNKATAFLRTGNEVWIGTQNGLYRVNIANGNHVCYLHSVTDGRSLPNDEITGLCLSPEGELLVGTLGGFGIFNSSDSTFDTYSSHPNQYGNTLLPGEMVRCIAARGRQIWVGLEAEGLSIVQRKPLQIISLSQLESSPSPIPTTPIRAMFIDSKGVLWLSATGYGLCREVGNLKFRNYNPENSALSDNSITAFCEDGRGRIWFGTVSGHLNYISSSSHDVIRLPEGYKSETAKSIDVIIAMVYDSINDYIWISSRSGLFIYDLSTSSFSRYSGTTFPCFGACLDSDRLWVSSRQGLSVIDLNTLESRMIEGVPYSMTLVPDGNTLWAGTFWRGVYRVDDCLSANPEITVYSEDNGLADNQVHGLLHDGIYLWVTTENGLSRIDTQLGEISSFGHRDGLKSMAFCESSAAKGSDGTIYFGQKEGLCILRPSYVRSEYGNMPDVVISGFWSGDRFHSLSHSETIEKDEKDTDFILIFSDLSYCRLPDVSYECRILPMDKSWSPVFENDTHVRFGHIPGGKYRIQIRAVDNEGNVLSQDEKTLEVRPVLYKRAWFGMLLFMLFVLVAYLTAVAYTRRVSRQRDLLREEVERQTKILNDQKIELEKKADELAEQNALLQKQNKMIASHNTLLSSTLSNRDTEFSSKLLDVIQKMYKDPNLDVHAFADAMGMSRSALNERIQTALGLFIAQFIRTYRLNVAKGIISNGTSRDMNISEIAYEVGFNDPKYFTRCFTKEFNATPSDVKEGSF